MEIIADICAMKRFAIFFAIVIMLCSASMVCQASDWHAWEGNALLPEADVYALSFVPDGRLLIGTGRGLYAVDKNNEIINIELSGTDATQPTVNQMEIRNGRVYIGTLVGTYILAGDSAVLCDTILAEDHIPGPLPSVLKDKIVKDVVGLRNGWKAYATNSDGIYLYRQSTGSVINMRRKLEDEATIPGNHVSSVTYDSNSGRLYASIYHSGIYYTEPELLAIETVKTGVEENVSSFTIDGKGRLWTAYDGAGIAVGRDTVLTSLPSCTVTNLLTLPDGNVLAASYGGGVFKVDTLLKTTPIKALGPDSYVSRSRGMALDSLGRLWIATFSNGVVRYDFESGKVAKFDISNSSLKTDYITDLFASPSGDSIFVASHYGIFAFDVETGSSKEIKTPFAGEDRIVAEQGTFDGKGNLYFATPRGLVDRYGKCMALEGVRLIALKGAKDGTLWCSSDSAVYHVDISNFQPEVETFAELNGLRFGKYALFDAGDGTVLAGAFGVVAVISSDTDEIDLNGHQSGSSSSWLFYLVGGLVVTGTLLFLMKRKSWRKKPSTVKPTESHEVQMEDNSSANTEVDAEADNTWLKSIDVIIDENLSNPDFSIEDMGRLAGMSRSNLYKRVKAITGLSPLEYLRDRRMIKGRELLAQATGKHVKPTLSEIAYRVGMSPRQFSKYLRK